MNELERYIREQFGQDRQELEELRQLAADALPTIVDSWNSEGEAWPYLFDKELEKDRYSFSTNAMILFMLSIVLERTRTSSLLPPMPQNSGLATTLFPRLKPQFRKDHEEKVKTCFERGVQKLFAKVREQHQSADKTLIRPSQRAQSTSH